MGKYQLFGKYEFQIAEKENEEEEDTLVHVKVDTPADKYLLDYMRIRIVDRSPSEDSSGNITETEKIFVLNQMSLTNLKLKPNGGAGYFLIIEGVMPYNTNEG